MKTNFASRLFVFILLVLSVALPSFALTRQPNADYRARRLALSKKTNSGIVILFAGLEGEGGNAINGFRQDNNFYYLSGCVEPGAALVISPEVAAKDTSPARPYAEILFLPQHNKAQEKWTGPKLGADNPQAASLTGFDRVADLATMHDEVQKLVPGNAATVYTDVAEGGVQSLSQSSMEWLRRTNTFPLRTTTLDVKPLLADLRMVKDAGEIDLIRHATDASVVAHFAALQVMKPGLNEHDVDARMQYEFMKRGCERPAYAPIVGAGFNSTVLHYSADDAPINDGDVVVMDVAGEYSMYASDITRTAPANGKFTARQREIYDIVLGAQQAAIAAFQAGKSKLTGRDPDSLYKVAYDYINTHGKDSHGQPLGQYFIHGLSHFVGLEVHDVGDYSKPADIGMVFTIEPGIYIPEEKLGVRIEDIFWVGPNGELMNLSGALPHTADEVEAAMTSKRVQKP
jgi:Xaa-Pro aminopeptidase